MTKVIDRVKDGLKSLIRGTKNKGTLLSLILLLVVSFLSLLPADELPPFPGTDKTHHLIAYAAVSFPVMLKHPRYLYLLAIGLTAYSGVIELIQPYVNRYGEWLDLAANACGVLIGGLLARYCQRFII